MRQITKQEREIFEYLNDLRASGATNMFGAGPYVQKEFGLDKNESRKFVSLWMKNFKESGDYDLINEN